MASTPEQVEQRWRDLSAVAEHYRDFRDFYWDCSVDLLGFKPTDVQLDIANFVANGPQYSMVQAQRGEAKTTITGCYAVWRLLQDPTTKILILSAGADLAEQISTWCISIIHGMDILAPLIPDKTHPGTRTSVKKYDIHHDLVGADRKSPSIACLGITSNMQGYRAGLLIADDVESGKNSRTQLMREQLRHITRDFTSINRTGKIVYLGTPQTVDSIYNDLPARGFDVRIWPGRYPTEKEEPNYGGHLAPFIKKRMDADPSLRTGYGMNGDRGAATDTGMMPEEELVRKEVDQGPAYFNLQYMLDTALTDADRYPLKLHHLMFYSFDHHDAPSKFIWTNDIACTIPRAVGSPIADQLFKPAKTSDTYLPYSHKLLAVDPAGGGQNGDETGLAVVFVVNGYFCAMEVTGIPGGSEPGRFQQIISLAKKWEVDTILVEKNYGNGAYTNSLRSACMIAEYDVGIEEVYNTGQKEVRISDTLEPVVASHRLIINSDVPEHDVLSTNKYSIEARPVFQFLFQFRFLTRERSALIHDDRLEALAMAVAHLTKVIAYHRENAQPQLPHDRFSQFRLDAAGTWRFAHRVETPGRRQLNVNVRQRFR